MRLIISRKVWALIFALLFILSGTAYIVKPSSGLSSKITGTNLPQEELISHNPISINGNDALASLTSSQGWN